MTMIPASRQAFNVWGRRLLQRSFASSSPSTPAMEKLSAIIAEHSQKNFNQGLPSSFITPIIDMAREDENGLMLAKEAKLALSKIEASNRLSHEEAWDILNKELGVQNEEDKVPSEQFWRLFFGNDHDKKKVLLW